MPCRQKNRENCLKNELQPCGAKRGENQERERSLSKSVMASQFLGPALLESASGFLKALMYPCNEFVFSLSLLS